mmetsp:Transcript_100653/g.307592  ORF Transcript_100653/g.307592 Transcript_100653/m.307592 type:complete len:336 (-) Transcript_100653:22-1029(-)
MLSVPLSYKHVVSHFVAFMLGQLASHIYGGMRGMPLTTSRITHTTSSTPGSDGTGRVLWAASVLEHHLMQNASLQVAEPSTGVLGNRCDAGTRDATSGIRNACLFSLHVLLRNLARARSLLPLKPFPQARPTFPRTMMENWMERIAPTLPAGSRCFEFGTLPGYAKTIFSNVCKHKHFTVDFSDKVKEDVTQKFQSMYAVNIESGIGAIPEASMDITICTQVFEHLRHPLESARNLYRITAPGGTLVFTVPTAWPYHAGAGFGNYFLYHAQGVRYILQSAGFVIEYLACQGDSWVLASFSEGLGYPHMPKEVAAAADCNNPLQIYVLARKPSKQT